MKIIQKKDHREGCEAIAGGGFWDIEALWVSDYETDHGGHPYYLVCNDGDCLAYVEVSEIPSDQPYKEYIERFFSEKIQEQLDECTS